MSNNDETKVVIRFNPEAIESDLRITPEEFSKQIEQFVGLNKPATFDGRLELIEDSEYEKLQNLKTLADAANEKRTTIIQENDDAEIQT